MTTVPHRPAVHPGPAEKPPEQQADDHQHGHAGIGEDVDDGGAMY
jgi:hypothetical protein